MKVLSGIQTSGNGELHIGNYLGAVKQWIELQNEHETFYMLANLHAITVPIEPAVAKENVFKMAAMYMALGIDPAKSTIFVQSLVPEHTELTWLLNTTAYMGEMNRMTQFKDKAGMNQEGVTVGLFDYPVLMASDILLYQANLVPVGEDQKQHIELTRNIAERFNNKYGQTFTLPEPFTPVNAARIMGLDNPEKKMSKSLGADNYIGLLDTPEVIKAKIQKAVTDSENVVRFDKGAKPGISNLMIIMSALVGKDVNELSDQYGSAGYGQFKNDLTEALVSFLSPIQAKYNTIIADRATLEKTLQDGSAKARTIAAATVAQAKQKMGVL